MRGEKKMEKELNKIERELKFDATIENLEALNYFEAISDDILEDKYVCVDREGNMWLQKGNMETHVLQEGSLLDEDEKEKLWKKAVELKRAR